MNNVYTPYIYIYIGWREQSRPRPEAQQKVSNISNSFKFGADWRRWDVGQKHCAVTKVFDAWIMPFIVPCPVKFRNARHTIHYSDAVGAETYKAFPLNCVGSRSSLSQFVFPPLLCLTHAPERAVELNRSAHLFLSWASTKEVSSGNLILFRLLRLMRLLRLVKLLQVLRRFRPKVNFSADLQYHTVKSMIQNVVSIHMCRV